MSSFASLIPLNVSSLSSISASSSSLAKSIDCTYSHVVKILQEMQKAGLVNFEKSGMLKLLSLTKTGQDVAEHIEGIKGLL